jgi:hypothetical protein
MQKNNGNTNGIFAHVKDSQCKKLGAKFEKFAPKYYLI